MKKSVLAGLSTPHNALARSELRLNGSQGNLIEFCHMHFLNSINSVLSTTKPYACRAFISASNCSIRSDFSIAIKRSSTSSVSISDLA